MDKSRLWLGCVSFLFGTINCMEQYNANNLERAIDRLIDLATQNMTKTNIVVNLIELDTINKNIATLLPHNLNIHEHNQIQRLNTTISNTSKLLLSSFNDYIKSCDAPQAGLSEGHEQPQSATKPINSSTTINAILRLSHIVHMQFSIDTIRANQSQIATLTNNSLNPCCTRINILNATTIAIVATISNLVASLKVSF